MSFNMAEIKLVHEALTKPNNKKNYTQLYLTAMIELMPAKRDINVSSYAQRV
jgi:hypothetical protein